MDQAKMLKLARAFARPYCVSRGEKFRLDAYDPADTGDLKKEDKPKAKRGARGRGGGHGRSCRTSCTRRTSGRCC
jgi:hypothetical protein